MLKKIIIVALGLFLIAAIGITYKINSSLDGMGINTENIILDGHEKPSNKNNVSKEQSNTNPSASNGKPTVIEEKAEDFYVLIIGVDYRQDQRTLSTDSILVAHFIPQNSKMKLVSLPRDLRVINRFEQGVKINSLFFEGYSQARQKAQKDPSLLSGKQVTIGSFKVPEEYISSGIVTLRESVEHFLQIDIEHTFLVNFQTVVSLVDAVGGVEINVTRSMHYDADFDNTHIHLEKGLQVLNGNDALGYARFRLDNRGEKFDSNDFERGMRQQEVIAALADKIISFGSLNKAFELLDIVSDNVKTDMSKSSMISLIREFYDDVSNDFVEQIPFEGYWESPFVWITDTNKQKLLENFKTVDE